MAELLKETLIKLYKTLSIEELEKLDIYEQAKLAFEEKQKIENLKRERIEKAKALVYEAIELLDIYSLELVVKRGGLLYIRNKHEQGSKQTVEGGTSRDRATNSMKTSQEEYVIPILKAIEQLGGRGRSREVLDIVYETMKSIFNSIDLEKLPSGSDIRWRNTARWARNTMVNQDLLKNDSTRGIWEISEKGKNYLKEHSNV
jgi:hypothetical protein